MRSVSVKSDRLLLSLTTKRSVAWFSSSSMCSVSRICLKLQPRRLRRLRVQRMNLSELQPSEGSTHRIKRIGRGIGSGHGKTCGKGTKGDKARGHIRPGFEGGQTPLHRRLPHFRGFTQPFKVEYTVIN